MTDWKVEIGPGNLLSEVLESQEAWRRLSLVGRAAVEQMLSGEEPTAHGNTLHALERHGFIEWTGYAYQMTEAGRRVAKWCVKL